MLLLLECLQDILMIAFVKQSILNLLALSKQTLSVIFVAKHHPTSYEFKIPGLDGECSRDANLTVSPFTKYISSSN